jgi:hypothetical protein
MYDPMLGIPTSGATKADKISQISIRSNASYSQSHPESMKSSPIKRSLLNDAANDVKSI